MTKVLTGLRVLEFAAIGPVPWSGMVLADLGASVVRVERPGSQGEKDTLGAVRRGRLEGPRPRRSEPPNGRAS